MTQAFTLFFVTKFAVTDSLFSVVSKNLVTSTTIYILMKSRKPVQGERAVNYSVMELQTSYILKSIMFLFCTLPYCETRTLPFHEMKHSAQQAIFVFRV